MRKKRISYKKSLRMGTRIESEHRPTINKLERRYNLDLPNRNIYKSIAKDHIKELGPGYYPALKRMEARLKARRRKRK